MAQPSEYDVHTNRPLTNIASKFLMDEGQFAADQAFPVVSVTNQTDNIIQYDPDEWFRDEARLRAPGKESQGGGYPLSETHYQCHQWAWHKDIADEIRLMEDAPLDSDRDATEWITQTLRIRRERLFALNFMAAGVWGTALQGVAGVPGALQFRQWNDYFNSTPIQDVRAAARAMWLLTGFQPNTMVMNKCVWDFLRHHPQIIARFVNTSAIPQLTEAQVASVFGLERIAISRSVYNGGPEGGTAVMAPCWPLHALLVYRPSGPSITKPSAGYIFQWPAGNKGAGIVIKKYRLANDADADRIRGSIYEDYNVVEASLGSIMFNAVAAC